MTETVDTIKFTPEKSKQIALARLDLIHKWLEHVDNVLKVKKYFSWGKMYILSKQN